MQKSEEIRSRQQHLWPEFRDLPRPGEDAKPRKSDDCVQKLFWLNLTQQRTSCDNWFPAVVVAVGCIAYTEPELSKGSQSNWYTAPGGRYTDIHGLRHTYIDTLCKNLPHQFRGKTLAKVRVDYTNAAKSETKFIHLFALLSLIHKTHLHSKPATLYHSSNMWRYF